MLFLAIIHYFRYINRYLLLTFNFILKFSWLYVLYSTPCARTGRVPEASLRGALESLDAAARRRRRGRLGVAATADQRAFAGSSDPCGSSELIPMNSRAPTQGNRPLYCTYARTHTADLRSRHSLLHEIVYEYYSELSSGSPLVDQSEVTGRLWSDRRLAAPSNKYFLHLRTHHKHLLVIRLNCYHMNRFIWFGCVSDELEQLLD